MPPTPPRRRRLSASLVAVAACAAACGGGAATMHPAHTLPDSKISVGAGVSSNFSFGSVDDAVRRGRSATAPGTASPDPEQDLVDGAVARAMTTEGLAPWVGARVGLPSRNEAGLTYAGRTARVDARHAFEEEHFALSVGGGVSAILLDAGDAKPPEGDGSEMPGVGRITATVDDFSVTGWGLDVPVIVGWRSTGEVVQIWGGARGGYERAFGELPIDFDPTVPLGEPGSESKAEVTADRWYAGGLIGLAVGVPPFWVAIELDAAYQVVGGDAQFPQASGDPSERTVSASGLTLTPTGAFIGKF